MLPKEHMDSHSLSGSTPDLDDIVLRVVALGNQSSTGESSTSALPGSSPEELSWVRAGVSLRQVEKRLVELTLQATAGNRTHAAELLGVSLRTVRNKIREYGLPRRRQA